MTNRLLGNTDPDNVINVQLDLTTVYRIPNTANTHKYDQSEHDGILRKYVPVHTSLWRQGIMFHDWMLAL